MRTRSMICLVTTILAVGLMVPAANPLYAAERMTPVRVTNLLGIDPNNNRVTAMQGGLWSVAVSSAPTLDVNTHPVTQSGTWNVGINNTPSVNVSNTPNVSITNTPTVNTPTQHNSIRFWTTNPTIPAGGNLYSGPHSCDGFRELRVAIRLVSAADPLITVQVGFFGPAYTGYTFGTVNFGSPAKTITDQGNWAAPPSLCTFTVPTMGNSFYIQIYNGTGSNKEFNSAASWAYMVN